MDGHDRRLAAFMAGDLGAADALRWDEHLLECERCWRAVREDRAGRQAAELLRQPAPAGLDDRVRLAVELAAAGATSGRQPRRAVRLRWSRLAAAGVLTLGLVVAVAVLLLPGGRAGMPAPVAAVARYAELLPLPPVQPEPGPGRPVAPVEAVSGRPFPMPSGAQGASAGGMAWSARLGILGLYCINGKTSELVAAPVPAAELAALAARLPP